MKIKIRILSIIAATALFSACSGVRNCTPPQLDLPAELDGNSTDSLTMSDLNWWQVYTDSALVAVIKETLEHNKDFLAAAERVEEMRQLYGVSKSNFFPEISGRIYGNYETNDYLDMKEVRDPEYGVKLAISWEADIWGGLKWARRKGEAQFVASVEQQRALRMTLIAEAASAYYRLIALDNELSIVRQSLETRRENVRVARLRFDGGITSELVYRQTLVEESATAALIPDLERRITQAQNAITLLMGRYPAKELARGQLWVEESLPDSLPTGLPCTLLQRRPDLRASEMDMRAALAQVGVNYANRFPSIRLSLTGGWENDDIKGLFRSPFTYALGELVGSVFDFGRRKRQYKAAEAAYEQARLRYEQSVLTAFSEVSDAAEAFRKARQTTMLRRELREAALKYVDLARIQYRAGATAYIDVLDAQRRFFEAQIGLGNAVRDEHLAFIEVYRALGGGF